MKKFKDFLYDKNDILIAVLILVVAASIIAWRMDVILQYPKQLIHNDTGVQHLLHLKSKSKILQPIEIMGFFYEFICQIQGNILL